MLRLVKPVNEVIGSIIIKVDSLLCLFLLNYTQTFLQYSQTFNVNVEFWEPNDYI